MTLAAEAAEKHEVSTVTLGTLVRAVLEDVEGNTAKAIQRVLFKLNNNPQLLKQIIEAAVRDAVYHRVQGSVRHDRFSIVRAINQQNAAQTIDRERDKNRVVALAEAISSCLLDMPLAGGKKLRDAGRAEIMAQIERYEKQAGSMSHKARWLRLILQSVPDGKRVGKVITEQRALELFEEARNTTEKTA
jgi:hypothetical protein